MNKPSEAAMEAAAKNAGDGCGLCDRKQLWNGEHTVVGRFRGRLVCVGECCTSRLRESWAVGIYYGGPTRPWQADDAAWFELHPKRSHRLRRAFPDETIAGWLVEKGRVSDRAIGRPPWIMVQQIQPGARRRCGVSVDRPEANDHLAFAITSLPDADQEAFAHALFDSFVDPQGHQRGVTTVSIKAILAQTLRFREAAGAPQ